MTRFAHSVLTLFFIACSTFVWGQNSFRSDQGWGNGWNTNDFGTTLAWGGSFWDFVNPGTGNRYFRFYTQYGGCFQEWGPAGDLQMTVGNAIPLTAGNSSAYFVDVQNTSWHYIFRTRDESECANPEAVFFEIQGDVRSISSINQSPTQVFPGQDVIITATLSGNNNIGQGYYLRYSTDGFTNSTVIEMTGSGSSYSASIPSSANTSNANLSYYVFSSGGGLTIVPADADFFSISLDNNGGGNYNYTVANRWETNQTGDWNTAATWTANAVPIANQPIQINAHDVALPANENITINALSISNGGSLNLGTNSTLTIDNFNELEVNGTLTSSTGSKFIAPLGGYNSGSGSMQFYDFEIGTDGGAGSNAYYFNSSVEISHDLLIEENGVLYPGNASQSTLSFSGNPSSLYNDGLLDCVPDLADINNERLAIQITSGETILRSNASPIGSLRMGDITVDAGAILSSDAAGSLQLELQFGTLTVDGSINLGQLATGVAPVTLRGIANNDYYLASSNPGQIFQFSDVLIGYNGANGGGHLQLASGSESIEMRVSGDFRNYYNFSAVNADTDQIDVVMNGAAGNQEVSGDMGETVGNTFGFHNLDISNIGGDVYFTSSSTDADASNNISFEIGGSLILNQGRAVTYQNGTGIRHNLILTSNATISDVGAQSDEDGQPCYIEGPLVRRVNVGTSNSLPFPVGQGSDFRNLVVHTDVSNGPVEITVEHFSYSANFAGMNILSPITNISDVRFWNVKVNEPANISNTQFEMSYGDADTDGVTQESDLRVVWAEQDASTDADPLNNEWASIGTTGGSSQIISSENFSFSGTSVDKIDLTLGNIGIGVNPLPVTWLEFTCTPLNNRNLLQWATASESNASHFEVEKADKNLDFQKIGQVNAQGWTTSKSDYSYSDGNITPGVTYYRLKQVDFDGAFEYSEIVAVNISRHAEIYPNPFSDSFNLNIENASGSAVEIWDAKGKLISNKTINQDGIARLTLEGPAGFYTLRITRAGGTVLHHKLTKQP